MILRGFAVEGVYPCSHERVTVSPASYTRFNASSSIPSVMGGRPHTAQKTSYEFKMAKGTEFSDVHHGYTQIKQCCVSPFLHVILEYKASCRSTSRVRAEAIFLSPKSPRWPQDLGGDGGSTKRLLDKRVRESAPIRVRLRLLLIEHKVLSS